MKKSTLLIILCSLAIVICCFLPWGYIPSQDKYLTGFDTNPTRLGKPGILIIVFTLITGLLHGVVRSHWAKKITFVAAAVLFAWQMRNWVTLAVCEFGECIAIQWTFHLLTLLILLLMGMLFLAAAERKK